jgi:phosphohistidine phosphatase SixA
MAAVKKLDDLLRCAVIKVLGLSALVAVSLIQPASASEEAWRALRQGGAVALIRHARAPGTGDPAGFQLEDCTTQRNLSDAGRKQAKRLGARFAAEGVHVARVLSSRWCRALDTARLAFGSKVEPASALDSFFDDRRMGQSQTSAARQLVTEWRYREGALVLVTHQVNITALTGVSPGEGEVVVLAREQQASTSLGGSRYSRSSPDWPHKNAASIARPAS